uniref:Uncharacterized protein n=1 Tax=Glossina palpalis gambiensis TaxID=67801 RepID=A0A1B0AQE6_9MUSC
MIWFVLHSIFNPPNVLGLMKKTQVVTSFIFYILIRLIGCATLIGIILSHVYVLYLNDGHSRFGLRCI